MSVMILTLLAAAGPARAAEVKIVEATASSTLPETGGVTYTPDHLHDRKQSSVWCEGDTHGSGLGTTIELALDGTHRIREIRIWNGNWYSWDFWNRHNRVKDLEVSIGDFKQTFTLADEKKIETIRLPKPVEGDRIVLKIKGIHRGTTFNDTVISELAVFDDSPDPRVRVADAKASSVLPEDADGNYEPANMWDGVVDSMWCEGEKDGDGTGSWVELDFGRPVRIGAMELVNGNGYSLPYWMKSNRAAAIQLRYDDGSTVEIKPKASIRPVRIPLDPVTTRRVRVTFTQVTRGKEYNDLCISELVFYEAM